MRRTAPAKQQRREQTRARLVEAALGVFALHGYDHATVEEISLAAGHSKGAYYFHFDSKEAIFLELLSTWVGEQNQRLRSFDRSPQPPTVALLETIESLLRYDDRNENWPALLPEFWAQVQRNEKVREMLHQAYEGWTCVLTGVLEKAERSGVFRLRVEAPAAAGLILALHDGLIAQRRLLPLAGKKQPLSRTLGAFLKVITEAAETTPQAGIPPVRKRTVKKPR
ncbi:MAG: TetR/AcrR family transcriptional regulator [Dehalococcoidia bacterium]|nr:TetR/AcrR family transcriptional regulator [Dehalococcoidia bacterium]